MKKKLAILAIVLLLGSIQARALTWEPVVLALLIGTVSVAYVDQWEILSINDCLTDANPLMSKQAVNGNYTFDQPQSICQ